jgi:uncharacterized protein YecE (DUF72 family)
MSEERAERIYVGTSGWSYKGWQRTFYPRDVPVKRHFEYYATQFPTVEINLTFYRLPLPEMVEGWVKKAPPGFLYAVKGSRFITHMKKLAGVEVALDRYFERIRPLRKKIGAVLWQLPPMLQLDVPRLDRFLKLLPSGYRYAVEFRHPSWLVPEVFALLHRRKAAYVPVSSLAMPMTLQTTADLVYIRFHGLEGGFAHDYTRQELEPWAAHVRSAALQGKTVFAYFNNDANVRAPANASMFVEMTGGRMVPSAGAIPS